MTTITFVIGSGLEQHAPAIRRQMADEWPELGVAFRYSGSTHYVDVEIPEDHGLVDAEGDAYTLCTLECHMEAVVHDAAFSIGEPNPLR